MVIFTVVLFGHRYIDRFAVAETGVEEIVRTPLRNDSRTVEVRHPDRRKQTPLPLVRQLEKLAWGPACCQSPRRLFYSIMPLRFLMVSPSIRMI